MFGKRQDSVVIVSRQEWDDMRADVRGLKRLAELEERNRTETDTKLAQAIDTLEARLGEVNTLLSSVAEISGRNATEFSNRLDRVAASVGKLREAAKAMTAGGVSALLAEVAGAPGAAPSEAKRQAEGAIASLMRAAKPAAPTAPNGMDKSVDHCGTGVAPLPLPLPLRDAPREAATSGEAHAGEAHATTVTEAV